ncbi:MAG: diguanylate cyclase [Nitrospirae bacterium]|nr:diguanylate cyclase [Nitrospirota bacterium]
MKKSIIVIICAIWMIIVGGSFLWNYSEDTQVHNNIAFETARGFVDLIVITRSWNSEHGGVYVPVTPDTQPNPYLELPLRDIRINDNLTLTKINPAYMTRQISEIAAERKGVRFHLTSLKPLRPENSPTSMEADALSAFDHGTKEVGRFIDGDRGPEFFYMSPLVVEKTCLDCHVKQGYKEGEIRGGISVTFPFSPQVPATILAVGHLVIGVAGLIGIIIFGTKLERYYEMLRRQSFVDSLTGIPNRRSFSDAIHREFGHAKRTDLPLSVLMCDVDRFKDYNDTYGHSGGDDCLIKVAHTIEKSLNRPDDFCARFGGEEFVVVLQNSTEEGARLVAEKIRAAVEGMGLAHASSWPFNVVTISIGIATYTNQISITCDDLVNRADRAMYDAKQLGRNRVEVYHDRDETMVPGPPRTDRIV